MPAEPALPAEPDTPPAPPLGVVVESSSLPQPIETAPASPNANARCATLIFILLFLSKRYPQHQAPSSVSPSRQWDASLEMHVGQKYQTGAGEICQSSDSVRTNAAMFTLRRYGIYPESISARMLARIGRRRSVGRKRLQDRCPGFDFVGFRHDRAEQARRGARIPGALRPARHTRLRSGSGASSDRHWRHRPDHSGRASKSRVVPEHATSACGRSRSLSRARSPLPGSPSSSSAKRIK